MKNYLILSSLLLAGLSFSACDADEAEAVAFDVALANDAAAIFAGDDVVFRFSGKPDYVTFYSGEEGSRYVNRHRTSVDVEALTLSYTFLQRYTENALLNHAATHIYISEDFDADYTPEGIARATWTQLSQTSGEEWLVPTATARQQTLSSSGDLSAYRDKRFTLAFRFETPRLEQAIGQPRVDIEPLTLTKIVDGHPIEVANPQADFGFRFVAEAPTAGNYSANATSLLFQPSGAQNGISVWAVSQQLDPSATSVDYGTPVRSMDMPAASVTHNYSEPGVYTATFVARNANRWNTEEAVREITIEVKER